MEIHEYAKYDAVGLRTLIGAGDVTAGEVEAAARQALAVTNERVNGLALPVFTPALDRAEDGPFAGVPFLIKDHGPVAAGVPFFLGSRSLPGIVADHDTDLMARFRAAGLVTLGLTTSPEMCVSFSTEPVRFGPARNPWDLDRGREGPAAAPPPWSPPGPCPSRTPATEPLHPRPGLLLRPGRAQAEPGPRHLRARPGRAHAGHGL
nr:hypothetical protein GCM10020093_009270 [Planobispora longispora]